MCVKQVIVFDSGLLRVRRCAGRAYGQETALSSLSTAAATQTTMSDADCGSNTAKQRVLSVPVMGVYLRRCTSWLGPLAATTRPSSQLSGTQPLNLLDCAVALCVVCNSSLQSLRTALGGPT